MQSISGLSVQRLTAIARHLNLECNGPSPLTLFDRHYVGWACKGALSKDDPASMVTLDFLGLAENQILSVSGQIHSSPVTSDFEGHCRRIFGYLLAAIDPSIAEPATGWLDHALRKQEVGKMESNGIIFDFILHHNRALAFDIHSVGF